jgi:hypothetical protein
MPSTWALKGPRLRSCLPRRSRSQRFEIGMDLHSAQLGRRRRPQCNSAGSTRGLVSHALSPRSNSAPRLGRQGRQHIVAVTSLWAEERVYWPVHAVPYTPASRRPGGERDLGFRTKPQVAVELVGAARKAGIRYRAVVADCAYGDNPGFTDALLAAGVPFVLALKPPARAPRRQRRRPIPRSRPPPSSAGAAPPDRWRRVERRFRNGHTETWWAADASLPAAGWGPSGRCGWWWPRPTPPACRDTAPGTC